MIYASLGWLGATIVAAVVETVSGSKPPARRFGHLIAAGMASYTFYLVAKLGGVL